jgi:hypothetical protein
MFFWGHKVVKHVRPFSENGLQIRRRANRVFQRERRKNHPSAICKLGTYLFIYALRSDPIGLQRLWGDEGASG